jgi:hypothetical protein
MSKYRFALSNWETRQEGIVEGDDFADAVHNLGANVRITKGDQLEIGVFGFPPARFECVGSLFDGKPVWMPANRLAA